MSFWTVPPIWEGGEVWIIGGGPSIPVQFGVPDSVINDVARGRKHLSAMSPYLSPLHHRHVIAVNSAFKLGRWIAVLFFGDLGWYRKNKDEVTRFPNLKITCANTPKTKEFS